MGMLTSLTGGGGLSASSGANTGPAESGSIGNTTLQFEGINTGTRGAMPGWVLPVGLAFVAIVGIIWYMRR